MWVLIRQDLCPLKFQIEVVPFLGDSAAIIRTRWLLVPLTNECITLLRHYWAIMPRGVQRKSKNRDGVGFHWSKRIVAAWDSVLRRILRSPLGLLWVSMDLRHFTGKDVKEGRISFWCMCPGCAILPLKGNLCFLHFQSFDYSL